MTSPPGVLQSPRAARGAAAPDARPDLGARRVRRVADECARPHPASRGVIAARRGTRPVPPDAATARAVRRTRRGARGRRARDGTRHARRFRDGRFPWRARSRCARSIAPPIPAPWRFAARCAKRASRTSPSRLRAAPRRSPAPRTNPRARNSRREGGPVGAARAADRLPDARAGPGVRRSRPVDPLRSGPRRRPLGPSPVRRRPRRANWQGSCLPCGPPPRRSLGSNVRRPSRSRPRSFSLFQPSPNCPNVAPPAQRRTRYDVSTVMMNKALKKSQNGKQTRTLARIGCIFGNLCP